MTLEEIKEKLAHMPVEQQEHVMAYLVHLRHRRDPESGRQIARQLDDQDSSHWISVDQLKEHWEAK